MMIQSYFFSQMMLIKCNYSCFSINYVLIIFYFRLIIFINITLSFVGYKQNKLILNIEIIVSEIIFLNLSIDIGKINKIT